MTTDLKVKIHEGGSRIVLPEGSGDKYKVRLMGWEPGDTVVHGSSADYPVSVIERDFAAAFPKGTRMRANHDGLCEDGGDIRRVIAKTIDDPFPESDGMYAHIRVAKQWSEYVKEFGDVIGLSISAAGELDPRNDQESEQFDQEFPKTVTRFYTAEESPYNSVDFVEAPGADGRIVAAIESAKSRFAEMNIREAATFASQRLDEKDSGAVPPQGNEKEKRMDEADRKVIVADVTEAVSAIVIEALKPSVIPVEVKYEDVAEAAIEAGLSKGSREAVYESVRAGATVAEAVEKQKAREDAITAEVTERLSKESTHFAGGGIVFGEGSTTIDFEARVDELAEGFVI